MKKLVLLSCLFVFVSCNGKDPSCESDGAIKPNVDSQNAEVSTAGCDGPAPAPEPDPVPVPEPTPDPAPTDEVPHEALIFDASIEYVNFETEDEVKVNRAVELIKAIVASKEFRDKVINFTNGGKKTFVDNNGLTNGQIYQILLNGAETLRPQIDNQMDLELELYYSWRSTVGYTYPDGLRIWMNTKFFNSYTPAEVAGNIFHEWTHKLGFDHASSYSVSRDSSVPYALGYIIEEMGKKLE